MCICFEAENLFNLNKEKGRERKIHEEEENVHECFEKGKY